MLELYKQVVTWIAEKWVFCKSVGCFRKPYFDGRCFNHYVHRVLQEIRQQARKDSTD